MLRPAQITIGRCMVAIAIIGYFCAFHELAVLLGIFAAALLLVAPALAAVYLACRFSVGDGRPPAPHRHQIKG
jgi:hypothetical protein